jgi:hypothetical protein
MINKMMSRQEEPAATGSSLACLKDMPQVNGRRIRAGARTHRTDFDGRVPESPGTVTL